MWRSSQFAVVLSDKSLTKDKNITQDLSILFRHLCSFSCKYIWLLKKQHFVYSLLFIKSKWNTHAQMFDLLSLWGLSIGVMVFIPSTLYFLSTYKNPTPKHTPDRKLSAFLHKKVWCRWLMLCRTTVTMRWQYCSVSVKYMKL